MDLLGRLRELKGLVLKTLTRAMLVFQNLCCQGNTHGLLGLVFRVTQQLTKAKKTSSPARL
jgi:hypothetical protein